MALVLLGQSTHRWARASTATPFLTRTGAYPTDYSDVDRNPSASRSPGFRHSDHLAHMLHASNAVGRLDEIVVRRLGSCCFGAMGRSNHWVLRQRMDFRPICDDAASSTQVAHDMDELLV